MRGPGATGSSWGWCLRWRRPQRAIKPDLPLHSAPSECKGKPDRQEKLKKGGSLVLPSGLKDHRCLDSDFRLA